MTVGAILEVYQLLVTSIYIQNAFRTPIDIGPISRRSLRLMTINPKYFTTTELHRFGVEPDRQI